MVDGPAGQRVWDNTTQGPYEIVCPGCGDDPSRDWSEISAELRRIRGMYATKEGAERAYGSHRHADTLTATAPPRRGTAQPNYNHAKSPERVRENARRPAVMAQISVASSGCRQGSYPDDLHCGTIHAVVNAGPPRASTESEISLAADTGAHLQIPAFPARWPALVAGQPGCPRLDPWYRSSIAANASACDLARDDAHVYIARTARPGPDADVLL